MGIDMRDKHKWAKEIKAFVDGDDVEYQWQDDDGYWSQWAILESLVMFGDGKCKFRIKPKERMAYLRVAIRNYSHGGPNCFETEAENFEFQMRELHNLALVFEERTNKLIRAEVING